MDFVFKAFTVDLLKNSKSHECNQLGNLVISTKLKM